MTIVFDKLAMVKRLEHEDAFTRPQAEVLAEALYMAMTEELVNKSDLRASETALRTDFTALRTDFTALRAELKATEASLKADIKANEVAIKASEAKLHSEMKAMEHSLKFWGGSVAVALFTALGGLITFLLRVMH